MRPTKDDGSRPSSKHRNKAGRHDVGAPSLCCTARTPPQQKWCEPVPSRASTDLSVASPRAGPPLELSRSRARARAPRSEKKPRRVADGRARRAVGPDLRAATPALRRARASVLRAALAPPRSRLALGGPPASTPTGTAAPAIFRVFVLAEECSTAAATRARAQPPSSDHHPRRPPSLPSSPAYPPTRRLTVRLFPRILPSFSPRAGDRHRGWRAQQG